MRKDNDEHVRNQDNEEYPLKNLNKDPKLGGFVNVNHSFLQNFQDLEHLNDNNDRCCPSISHLQQFYWFDNG